jgi:hypothetical protein
MVTKEYNYGQLFLNPVSRFPTPVFRPRKNRLTGYASYDSLVRDAWLFCYDRPELTVAPSMLVSELTVCHCQHAPRTGSNFKNYLKMNERRGNVYENKGRLLKTRERSGNVHENKGT